MTTTPLPSAPAAVAATRSDLRGIVAAALDLEAAVLVDLVAELETLGRTVSAAGDTSASPGSSRPSSRNAHPGVADRARAAGEERGRGQVMADALVATMLGVPASDTALPFLPPLSPSAS
jgi:hypothetical protein